MDIIDKYFKSKTENITFIELKENSFIELEDYTIKDHIPLPILASELIKGIQEGEYQDEIGVNAIIDGIVYTLGTDSEFPYSKEYMDILIAYDENIVDYVFYNAIKDLEAERLDEGCIKLRALSILNPTNTKVIFNYGLGIEALAKKLLESDKEKGEQFLDFSTKLFESILETDENYPLVHYKLGFHYLFNSNFLKASLSWKKYIAISEDELLIQEIRNELEKIEDDVLFETGLTYLIYHEYEKALSFMLKLMPKYKDNWNLNYSLGKCYAGLEQFDLAIDYINHAIELNKDNPDLYNELGIIYFNNGDINRAIELFTKGIEIYADLKLFFNRAMSYGQIKEYRKALDDINEAYRLNPNEDIKNHRDYFETIVKNMS